jgi:two-component sensor histidine kinase/ActR/RegA family two-component response regulator
MRKDASERAPVNILLVDDQPAKLLSYEVILSSLGEGLVRANSAREALALLLKIDVAVVLIDVDMPEMNGFQLAKMIREHPRFHSTAIIFVSAVHFSTKDTILGYEMGAVDYVSVPVIAEVLRAKVRVFVDLYRKSRALELFSQELEKRVAERTVELEAAVERQMILAREVDHRAKNALAVVQAIIRLSRSESFDEYVLGLEGRIGSLARSHTLLSESRWQGANFMTILQEELAPYRHSHEGRITVEGPSVVLSPTATQNLALVVHELATNAAKYGALSKVDGHLNISVDVTGEGLDIRWFESGIPTAGKPKKIGFGSRLIPVIMQQLGGSAHYDWTNDGLKFTAIVSNKSDPGTVRADRCLLAETKKAEHIGGKSSVLVVEDEPVIGMLLTSLLLELDFKVLGPFPRIAQAMTVATNEPLHLAILDINVAGELVYPLAAMLKEQKTPLIFVSGYAAETIDSRFVDIPVLEKPIEVSSLRTILEGLSAS